MANQPRSQMFDSSRSITQRALTTPLPELVADPAESALEEFYDRCDAIEQVLASITEWTAPRRKQILLEEGMARIERARHALNTMELALQATDEYPICAHYLQYLADQFVALRPRSP